MGPGRAQERDVVLSIATTFLIGALVLGAAALVLWRISVRLGDVSFVDSWWPLGMALAGLLAFIRTPGHGAHALVVTLVSLLWAVRLGTYLLLRWRRQGPDKRYTEMLDDARTRRGWSFEKAALLLVFLLQAPLQVVVAAPLELTPLSDAAPLGLLAGLGATAALAGIVFEAVADQQLAAFKARPENRGKVMDRGLWSWSRHPNFFGEAMVWWGLYAVALETPYGPWSLPGPLLITFLLTRGSGAPTVEKAMAAKGEAYRRYVETTSGFIPMPPRRSQKG